MSCTSVACCSVSFSFSFAISLMRGGRGGRTGEIGQRVRMLSTERDGQGSDMFEMLPFDASIVSAAVSFFHHRANEGESYHGF